MEITDDKRIAEDVGEVLAAHTKRLRIAAWYVRTNMLQGVGAEKVFSLSARLPHRHRLLRSR